METDVSRTHLDPMDIINKRKQQLEVLSQRALSVPGSAHAS